MRSATVVLPVPGLPVKLMCSDGGSLQARAGGAASRPAAARRSRGCGCLTGARPTSSRSSCVEHLGHARACGKRGVEIERRWRRGSLCHGPCTTMGRRFSSTTRAWELSGSVGRPLRAGHRRCVRVADGAARAPPAAPSAKPGSSPGG